MPSLQKPKKWNLKPGLTQAPDLWRNVLFAAPLWEGGGLGQDLVSGALADVKFGGGYTTGRRGTAFDVSANAQGMYWPVLPGGFDMSDLSNEEFFCVHILVDITNTRANSFNRLIEVSDSGSSDRWNIYINSSETMVVWNSSDSADSYRFSNYTLGTGLHSLTFVVPKNAATERTAKYYVNGELKGESSSGHFQTSPNADVVMGLAGGKDGIQSSVYGDYYMLVVWKRRGLTPEEVKFLHSDPFAMFRPAGF